MNNPVIEEISFDHKKGALLYKGIRYMLIRPETIVAFQKSAEKTLSQKAWQLFKEGGFEGGKLSAQRLKEVFKLKDKQIIEKICEMGTQIGWGKFKLVSFDLRRKDLFVEVRSSPFAYAYGKSDHPVCHFLSGVLSGVGYTIFRDKVDVKEVACRATGKKTCIFRTC